MCHGFPPPKPLVSAATRSPCSEPCPTAGFVQRPDLPCCNQRRDTCRLLSPCAGVGIPGTPQTPMQVRPTASTVGHQVQNSRACISYKQFTDDRLPLPWNTDKIVGNKTSKFSKQSPGIASRRKTRGVRRTARTLMSRTQVLAVPIARRSPLHQRSGRGHFLPGSIQPDDASQHQTELG
ncbi:hypothetical protein CEXT_432751 [Caerostris extrusa]|uniref:Uncharacterized protein n=1 Tax=Caerostris extrusa TaxID=172846 RepID=A0AAV4PP01_CAEEX|nr:hypothetical protein CEXT_432751 [Caerostris extrusa]